MVAYQSEQDLGEEDAATPHPTSTSLSSPSNADLRAMAPRFDNIINRRLSSSSLSSVSNASNNSGPDWLDDGAADNVSFDKDVEDIKEFEKESAETSTETKDSNIITFDKGPSSNCSVLTQTNRDGSLDIARRGETDVYTDCLTTPVYEPVGPLVSSLLGTKAVSDKSDMGDLYKRYQEFLSKPKIAKDIKDFLGFGMGIAAEQAVTMANKTGNLCGGVVTAANSLADRLYVSGLIHCY